MGTLAHMSKLRKKKRQVLAFSLCFQLVCHKRPQNGIIPGLSLTQQLVQQSFRNSYSASPRVLLPILRLFCKKRVLIKQQKHNCNSFISYLEQRQPVQDSCISTAPGSWKTSSLISSRKISVDLSTSNRERFTER